MPSTLDTDLDGLVRLLDEADTPQRRAELEAEIGRRYIRRGDHDRALRHLVSARKLYDGMGDLRTEAVVDADIGTACAYKGEYERALTYFERTLDVADDIGDNDLRARTIALLGDLALGRGDLDRAGELWQAARVHFEQYWDGRELARCNSGLALLAARDELFDQARELAARAEEEAESSGDPLWIGRAQLTRALVLWQAEDLKLAKRYFRRAITLFQRHDLRRELAEAYLRYGLFCGHLGDKLGDGAAVDPAAYWLAKSQDLYRELGGLADLERVRDAFRRYGRRATDRVAEVEILQLLQELKQNRVNVQRATQRLSDLVMTAVETSAEGGAASDRGIRARTELLGMEQILSRSLDEMALAEERFLGAVNAVVVERENIRTLIDLTRTLSTIENYGQLPAEIARLASQLAVADRAAVAIAEDDGAPAVRGAYGIPDQPEPACLEALAATSRPEGRAELMFRPAKTGDDAPAPRPDGRSKQASERQQTLRLGYAMVVPLRHGERVFGAIYLDKELTGGVFTERDLDLLAVFAGQAAAIWENRRIQEELRLAARTKAATLEAISDGVVSIDAAGNVTSLNATAGRLLGIRDLGRLPRRSSLHELDFLRGCLDRGEELDGRLVSLASGEYLCNTRLISSDEGTPVGLVATFTEMKRATSLAHRIVGSTARYSFGDMIGHASVLKRQLLLAEAAARSDSNVLITGESGTGKEVLAQAIHNAGPRAGGPFVALNCAAIPRDLLESELFGYESGAFTGARKGGRPGKFELAEGGTILLDEIGDMPLEMQAKLLRVLQERTAQRVGGSREIPLNCRVVATTNRDLQLESGRGMFRQDLFFRLRVIHIDLPPLRERPEDIALLTEHFLRVYSARMGKQLTAVDPRVMHVLMSYPWPGNIRELEHVLESEVNLAASDQVSLDEVPVMLSSSMQRPGAMQHALTPMPAMAPPMMVPAFGTPPHGGSYGGSYGSPYGTMPGVMPNGTNPLMTMSQSERELLEKALVAHRGRIPDVARALGVSRGTVYNKMKKFNLDPDQYRQ